MLGLSRDGAGECVDEFFATGAGEPDDKHALAWRDVQIDAAQTR
jgi:hypothetical protein